MRVRFALEAGSDVGLGHWMRNVELSAEFQRRGHDVERWVVGVHQHESVDKIFSDVGSAEQAWMASPVDILVVDGYRFSRDVSPTSALVSVGWSDRLEDAFRGVTVTLNHNGYADALRYPASAGKVLAGLRYTIVRRDFIGKTHKARAHKVLVAMGGADPLRLSAGICRALASVGESTRLVVGSANPLRDQLVSLSKSLPSVEVVVDPRDVADVYSECDVAVVACGSTVYEMLALQVPFAGVVVADNQLAIGMWLQRNAVPLLTVDALQDGDALQRVVSSLRDPNPVRLTLDGQGAARVVDFLEAEYSQ